MYLFCIWFCSVKDTPEVDKHPEKRMKAAYEEFEKERIPQLKIENPTLRLSQLKQLLRKEWMKHPNNPLNMKLAAMQNKSWWCILVIKSTRSYTLPWNLNLWKFEYYIETLVNLGWNWERGTEGWDIMVCIK